MAYFQLGNRETRRPALMNSRIARSLRMSRPERASALRQWKEFHLTPRKDAELARRRAIEGENTNTVNTRGTLKREDTSPVRVSSLRSLLKQPMGPPKEETSKILSDLSTSGDVSFLNAKDDVYGQPRTSVTNHIFEKYGVPTAKTISEGRRILEDKKNAVEQIVNDYKTIGYDQLEGEKYKKYAEAKKKLEDISADLFNFKTKVPVILSLESKSRAKKENELKNETIRRDAMERLGIPVSDSESLPTNTIALGATLGGLTIGSTLYNRLKKGKGLLEKEKSVLKEIKNYDKLNKELKALQKQGAGADEQLFLIKRSVDPEDWDKIDFAATARTGQIVPQGGKYKITKNILKNEKIANKTNRLRLAFSPDITEKIDLKKTALRKAFQFIDEVPNVTKKAIKSKYGKLLRKILD